MKLARWLPKTALAGLILASGSSVHAQSYPDKPIRLIVPFAAGGSVDSVARLTATQLSDKLGQQVVVENRGGAGGNIGTQAVVSAAADGYTLLWGVASNIAINASLYKTLPYKVSTDLTPIASVAQVPNLLLINNDIPAQTIEEFIAYAKAHPGLAFASAGVGSSGHLTSELFKAEAGLDMIHVPYKGTALAYPDLIEGRVAMMSDGVTSPMAKSGKVRALAVSAANRSSQVPEIPTFTEKGLESVRVDAWMGLFAPTGIPDAAVKRLNDAINEILAEEPIRQRLEQMGAEPMGGSSDEFAQFVGSEIDRWQSVIQKLDIQVD